MPTNRKKIVRVYFFIFEKNWIFQKFHFFSTWVAGNYPTGVPLMTLCTVCIHSVRIANPQNTDPVHSEKGKNRPKIGKNTLHKPCTYPVHYVCTVCNSAKTMYWTVFDDFPCTNCVHCLYFAYFWGCTESAKFCEKVENCLCRVCTQPVSLCTDPVHGMYRVCFRTMYKQCLGRTESVHSLKNRVKNTVYTVFAVCRDCVFLILGKNTEPLYFCKNTVCTDYVHIKNRVPAFWLQKPRNFWIHLYTLGKFHPYSKNFPTRLFEPSRKRLYDRSNLFFGVYGSNTTPRGIPCRCTWWALQLNNTHIALQH